MATIVERQTRGGLSFFVVFRVDGKQKWIHAGSERSNAEKIIKELDLKKVELRIEKARKYKSCTRPSRRLYDGRVLRYLEDHGGYAPSISVIGEDLDINFGTLTGTINRLEIEGDIVTTGKHRKGAARGIYLASTPLLEPVPPVPPEIARPPASVTADEIVKAHNVQLIKLTIENKELKRIIEKNEVPCMECKKKDKIIKQQAKEIQTRDKDFATISDECERLEKTGSSRDKRIIDNLTVSGD